MKVLLTDGSGLTARQTAGLLDVSGHHVEVLSPDPWCLCRFTRHVRRVRRVPAFGADPVRWLDAAIAAYREGGFDVLLPTQEQVGVLAASAHRLRAEGVRTAVPDFDSLAAVQDKVSAWRTLAELGVPQPVASTDRDSWRDFPCFVKQPIGTASGGVRRVSDVSGLRGEGDAPTVLIQAAADGPLAMCQAVFDHGRLVAFHSNLRVTEGANGGASHKRGIDLPAAEESLSRLGRSLGWHGALSADVIVSPTGPLVIDVNPRLVEPTNAAANGVDLVGALLAVATAAVATAAVATAAVATADGTVEPRDRAASPGRATHQLILALLGTASRGEGRRAILREWLDAARRRGGYTDSTEELTPVSGDPLAALAVLRVFVALLWRPSSWAGIASGSVRSYAVTPAAWDQIVHIASSGPGSHAIGRVDTSR